MNVCPECFSNPILKRRIREIRPKFPDDEKCVLHPSRKGVPIGEVGRIVDPVLRGNYSIGEWLFDHQAGDDLYTVVSESTGAEDDAVVVGLVEWLIDNDNYWPPDGEDAFYGDDQTYVPIELDGWQHSILWSRFRDEILHGQRFFNSKARNLLEEIFDGIHYQSDIEGKPAFYKLGPSDGVTLFRARLFDSDIDFEEIANDPASKMGPPPAGLRRAGRMNAAGIGVFYGATDSDTAIAELRPAVGSNVCVASFKLRRSINVLDLSRFTRPGKQLDIFAKNHVKRTTQWAFLQSFANEISKPILPNDEHLQYVPAQVVAEYLTHTPMKWHGDEISIDAIIFASAQSRGGKNIAIVGDASGIVPEYVASKELSGRDQTKDFDFQIFDYAMAPQHISDPALTIAKGAIEKFEIESAKYGRSRKSLKMPRSSDDF